MKVRAGARPGGKLIEVELEDEDMLRDMPDWHEKGASEKWRAMTDRADMMLVEYMLRRGDISREYAETRIREIKGLT